MICTKLRHNTQNTQQLARVNGNYENQKISNVLQNKTTDAMRRLIDHMRMQAVCFKSIRYAVQKNLH